MTNNRKKSNKTTVYLTDRLRDYLVSESSKPGNTRSSVVQAALTLLKESTE